jgi:pimeloyl-ACP methyl ester carboxylesterase
LLGAALVLLSGGCAAPPSPSSDSEPTVVLLHGLVRTSRSMRPMGRALADAGFRVVNVDYPSLDLPIGELAEHLDHALRREVLPAREVHFVGHSAGGILARYFLAERPDFPVGRMVMLGPPNAGSELAEHADFLERWTGPLTTELARGPDSVPAALPVPPYDLGVIAGDRSVLPSSWLIEGPDDGLVAVSETHVSGARDHLVVRRSHTWIMNSDEVQRQTVHFLRRGSFAR